MTVDTIEQRLRGYVLFEGSLEEITERLSEELQWKIIQKSKSYQDALVYLSEFTSPATRHVLFSGHNGWIVMLDNVARADVDRVPFLAFRLSCRAIRVVDCPESWKQKETDRFLLSHETHVVQYHNKSVNIEKSIFLSAAKGEETEFNVYDNRPDEAPHLEEFVDRSKRRARDRFNSLQLEALVAAFGTKVISENEFIESQDFILMSEDVTRARPDGTPVERDNPAWQHLRIGIEKSGEKYKIVSNWYDSVIHHLEKSIKYDASYKEKAQPYLNKAYEAKRMRENEPMPLKWARNFFKKLRNAYRKNRKDK